jgi:hypothetical protein
VAEDFARYIAAPVTFAAQVHDFVRKTPTVPFFGATAGFIVNYGPDDAVGFDVDGIPVEVLNHAYFPGRVSLKLGRQSIPAASFFKIGGQRRRRRMFSTTRVINSCKQLPCASSCPGSVCQNYVDYFLLNPATPIPPLPPPLSPAGELHCDMKLLPIPEKQIRVLLTSLHVPPFFLKGLSERVVPTIRHQKRVPIVDAGQVQSGGPGPFRYLLFVFLPLLQIGSDDSLFLVNAMFQI